MKKIILMILVISSSFLLFSSQVKAYGKYVNPTKKPIYDFNISESRSLFGLEFGVWKVNPSYKKISDFIGFDLAILANTSSEFSFYSELQFGYMFAGISIGPYIDINADNNNHGLQYTLWVNYFVGGYLRFKQGIYSDSSISIGVYIWIPFEFL